MALFERDLHLGVFSRHFLYFSKACLGLKSYRELRVFIATTTITTTTTKTTTTTTAKNSTHSNI